MSIITKKCTKCGEIEEFYVRKNGNPQDCCKKCFNKRGSVYQKLNLDKARNNSKLRHSKNPEKFNGERREWAKNNPEKRKQIVHKYYESHKEHISLKTSLWNKNNPYKRSMISHRRKAKKLLVGGNITAREWEDLLIKYNYTCLCCKRSNIKLELDHAIPLVKGGLNAIENAQPLCRSCNASKGTKTIDYR